MLGIIGVSYMHFIRTLAEDEKVSGFLEKAKSVGLDGVEIMWDHGMMKMGERDLLALRRRADDLGMYLELNVGLLTDSCFEECVKAASKMGCKIVNTFLGMQCRPKTIKSVDDARAFNKKAKADLKAAEEIGRKYGARIAVETHTDRTADDWVDIMEEARTEHVGLRLDTANCLWTAEDPVEVSRKLAPYVETIHLKDWRIVERPDLPCGYTTQDVVSGQGHVNLKSIVSILKKTKPDIDFTIECITCCLPIELPWLDEAFWNTFEKPDAGSLVKMLKLIKNTPRTGWEALRDCSLMTADEVLEYENHNVKACINYAQEVLGI